MMISYYHHDYYLLHVQEFELLSFCSTELGIYKLLLIICNNNIARFYKYNVTVCIPVVVLNRPFHVVKKEKVCHAFEPEI